ncbi:MAG: pyruvate kinase, partial [Phycisphaerae bacterium]
MPKTKIVATVGPASSSKDTLDRFVKAGVNVIRLNMSHGMLDDHAEVLEHLAAVLPGPNTSVAVMADLCGPKVRTCVMDEHASSIGAGDQCVVVRTCDLGNASRFATSYPRLVDEVNVSDRILIDDGTIRLRVTEKNADELTCRCEIGGTIGTRKGVNVPDSDLSQPSLTQKDRTDLQWAIEHDVDFVALSFVRRVDDVTELREAIRELDGRTPIVSKIETPQAVAALDDIIDVSDAILVARGDLGVEMDVSRIPMLQKQMVRQCQSAGKPVIVATQMLHSMVTQASPTRAEVSDVANAVLDGADAVMLSAESAAGRYPVESVSMMARIIGHAHAYQSGVAHRRTEDVAGHLHVGLQRDRTTSAVARSAVIVAHDLGASLIAVWSNSGRTARWISKYQPEQPVAVISASAAVCRRCAMSYGIRSLLVPEEFTQQGVAFSELQRRLLQSTPANPLDIVVLVGDPSAASRAPTLSIR